MVHGFSAIPLTDMTDMFQIDTTGRTQGHSLKLVKCQCNKDIRKYFFSHRVVSKWNMLDNDTVMAKTVNGFKTKREPGKEDGSVFGLMSAGPRGRNGILERPSCKYAHLFNSPFPELRN